MTADWTCNVCGIGYTEAHERAEGARWTFHWAGPVQDPYVEICSDECWRIFAVRARRISPFYESSDGEVEDIFEALSNNSIAAGDGAAKSRSFLRECASDLAYTALNAPIDQLRDAVAVMARRVDGIADFECLRDALIADDPAISLLNASSSIREPLLREMAAEFAGKVVSMQNPFDAR